MSHEQSVVFEDVSKFYGETLGVDRISLELQPGVTSLVGPNGAGKSTLMNLLTGLIRPSRGSVRVLGVCTSAPERLFRIVGYCSHVDAFPPGVTGRQFIANWLSLHGFDAPTVARLTDGALERVGMSDAADRRVASYSKGMRQRIRLALAISHEPSVLVLDEPLNGLDPMARADAMALFLALAEEGLHVIISSHILHEVERISDRVVLLSQGYMVADGPIHGVRSEVANRPMQMRVRCASPQPLAARLFTQPHIVEVKLEDDGTGLLARTKDMEAFYSFIQQCIVDEHVDVHSVAPSDDDAFALYSYLIGSEA